MYLQNIFIPFGSSPEILGVTWSLAVEEQSYLLWPFLVMRFSRQGLVKICLALLIAIGLSIGDLKFWRPQVYSLGCSLMAAFCAGLIFLVLRLRDHTFVRLVFEASWLRLCGARELDLVVGIRSTGIVLERCLKVF